jgi:hypothetical protein
MGAVATYVRGSPARNDGWKWPVFMLAHHFLPQYMVDALRNEAAMTPFETITLMIALIGLVGGFAYAGIQIGRWIGGRK